MFSFSTLWRFSSMPKEEYFPLFWSKNIFSFEAIENQEINQALLQESPLKISNLAMQFPWETKEEIPSLCSLNSEESVKAFSHIMAAAQKAISFETKYVILWPGRIGLHEIFSREAKQEEKIALRKKIAAPYLEKICRSLFTMSKKYPDIVFCLSPARHLEDFPLFSEMEAILDDLKSISLAYWHNPVNCYFLKKMGLPPEEAWLEKYAKKMAGIHLEDAIGTEGLYPIGTGEISFQNLKDAVPQNAIRVLRVESRFNQQEVFFAWQNLQEMGLIN